ncbi:MULTISPECIES: xanthine dehydrogenase family protein subunit M [unclassified Siphonobacter]|uniref:FAD binding domain-containing protein n=1 Tax=unclassified Siphonobacter TaxID=2635712 RepID=UPI000CBC29D1|nr:MULTISPECIES: xanthine dehydrogenase family protein subunit M [unclassified Siphonobacter]MDQ1089224.1 xanthine dehydrogenase YagS FAD-binding subunit [Siphonobacter sp. SORGH_AS_1065]MDR6195397.1 xanthine dehydrogenase YagS FAD-binding subunit [Siphonobacter sp. SORGH_AS_0500]PKK34890.1 FAD-binding molybdopterin dehydrogenase [Siphonobacter sp. SORGH_AS_0500]
MNPFAYTRAYGVDTALNEKTERAHYIGGGTNLIDLMKENVMHSQLLIDVNHLPFHEIEETESGGLLLGAMMTNAETAYHPLIEERYPLLAKAILAGASPQLRNMATNGGNLMQRTRCYYFYDTATPCNKREPGSGCSAINGYNRIHAILGTSSECIATHPSDMCVALAALDATVHVSGRNGDRTIAFNDFHRLPEMHPEKDNTLESDELITGIELPEKGFKDHFTYIKIRDRQSYAFALVSVAAALELDGDTITDARIALGGVAHKPWRDQGAESLLKGKKATEENFEQVAETILANAQGYGHNTFKIELAKRAIIRALSEATENVHLS